MTTNKHWGKYVIPTKELLDEIIAYFKDENCEYNTELSGIRLEGDPAVLNDSDVVITPSTLTGSWQLDILYRNLPNEPKVDPNDKEEKLVYKHPVIVENYIANVTGEGNHTGSEFKYQDHKIE